MPLYLCALAHYADHEERGTAELFGDVGICELIMGNRGRFLAPKTWWNSN